MKRRIKRHRATRRVGARKTDIEDVVPRNEGAIARAIRIGDLVGISAAELRIDRAGHFGCQLGARVGARVDADRLRAGAVHTDGEHIRAPIGAGVRRIALERVLILGRIGHDGDGIVVGRAEIEAVNRRGCAGHRCRCRRGRIGLIILVIERAGLSGDEGWIACCTRYISRRIRVAHLGRISRTLTEFVDVKGLALRVLSRNQRRIELLVTDIDVGGPFVGRIGARRVAGLDVIDRRDRRVTERVVDGDRR